MLVLAIFLPPTGMIKPDDAPEYAHNTMQYMPKRDANGTIIAPEEAKKESKKKGGKTKRSKKNTNANDTNNNSSNNSNEQCP